jgi:hypothetical protein
MTEPVQLALIAVIASIGPTIVGIINAVHQSKSNAKVDVIGENVKKVETQTNSMKDALIASTALASRAEGAKDEKLRAAVEKVDKQAVSTDTPKV